MVFSSTDRWIALLEFSNLNHSNIYEAESGLRVSRILKIYYDRHVYIFNKIDLREIVEITTEMWRNTEFQLE